MPEPGYGLKSDNRGDRKHGYVTLSYFAAGDTNLNTGPSSKEAAQPRHQRALADRGGRPLHHQNRSQGAHHGQARRASTSSIQVSVSPIQRAPCGPTGGSPQRTSSRSAAAEAGWPAGDDTSKIRRPAGL